MKLITFVSERRERVGAIAETLGMVVDLSAATADAPQSMLALIEGGERALDQARTQYERCVTAGDFLTPLGKVSLRAPLPVPAQIRDFMSFPTHIRQAPVGMKKLAARLASEPIPEFAPRPDVPAIYVQQPAFYFSNRFSVVGHDEEINWPSHSNYMDFELEVAAIIARDGKNIAAGKAADFIFGYTVYNDFSARDTQLVEMKTMLGPGKGKSFDTGNALGPCIVTRDELPDIVGLAVTARVNGNVWGSGTLDGMLHSFPDIIASASRDETLRAGEVLGSGTVGNCCGLEHDRYLADGDVVELDVERIGTLRNRIARRA
jgi:2-keto-4-pentenoate hydratase/2-oxohepta-3-ene-1,7-dioic acid hydratase in catechol pathway